MMKDMRKKKSLIMILSALLLCLIICGIYIQPKQTVPVYDESPSEAFRKMLKTNPEVEQLMRKSIAAAAEINPDRETNPVQSLDEIYDFIDYTVTCMPWNILPEERYDSFATKCDQSILYLYWLMDQPLDELRDKDLFYPSVEYLEPVYIWLSGYNNSWRDFLDTKDS